MFDKDHLEGWCIAWDLVGQNLEVPFPKESFEMELEVWSEGPWGSKCCGTWSWFSIPPFDGGIDSIQGENAKRLLNVVGQASKSIAKGKSSIIGS
jgi:hypothetical protein